MVKHCVTRREESVALPTPSADRPEQGARSSQEQGEGEKYGEALAMLENQHTLIEAVQVERNAWQDEAGLLQPFRKQADYQVIQPKSELLSLH